MGENGQNGHSPPQKAGGVGELLTDPNRLVQDMKMIRRAVIEDWPVSRENRMRLMVILMQIAETDTFEVDKVECERTGIGEQMRENKTASIRMPNHRNQIAAARTLQIMVAQTARDRHHLERLEVNMNRPPVVHQHAHFTTTQHEALKKITEPPRQLPPATNGHHNGHHPPHANGNGTGPGVGGSKPAP